MACEPFPLSRLNVALSQQSTPFQVFMSPTQSKVHRFWQRECHSWWNHTGVFLLFDCVTHVTPYFRLAFCFNVMSSSYIRNLPKARTARRNVESMDLVKQSASIMAVLIQRHCVWFLDCSFNSITSIVVCHSWQFGTAVLVTKSNKDLQSVIISPGCSLHKAFSGLCHSNAGFLIWPHMHLIQVNLSSELDIAYASALKVDLTTRPICLVCQTMGEKSVVSFFASWGVHAMMNIPCCADSCLADAKLASPKLAKLTSWIGIGLTITEVAAWSWASLKTLLASSRVWTEAVGMHFCNWDTLAAISGREWTAAYWRLPQSPRSWFISFGFIQPSNSLLRDLGMSIGEILWTYFSWLTRIEKSGSCSISNPVKRNFCFSWDPNGNFFWRSCNALENSSLPAPKPSSTWVPTIPFRMLGLCGSLSK